MLWKLYTVQSFQPHVYAPGWKLLTQIYFLPDIVTFTVIFSFFFLPFYLFSSYLYVTHIWPVHLLLWCFVFFWSHLKMFLYQLICCSLPRPPHPPPLWWKGSAPLSQVKVIFCKVVMMMMLLGSLCSATEAIAAVMSPADFKMPPFHHDGGLILLWNQKLID